jgi:hypothetical protein
MHTDLEVKIILCSCNSRQIIALLLNRCVGTENIKDDIDKVKCTIGATYVYVEMELDDSNNILPYNNLL